MSVPVSGPPNAHLRKRAPAILALALPTVAIQDFPRRLQWGGYVGTSERNVRRMALRATVAMVTMPGAV
jgi:hypothetical protein